MDDRIIWPGQKVEGHTAAVARVSRERDLWRAACPCGWEGSETVRGDADKQLAEHLREAVAAGRGSPAAAAKRPLADRCKSRVVKREGLWQTLQRLASVRSGDLNVL
jgi:hypothetical protein